MCIKQQILAIVEVKKEQNSMMRTSESDVQKESLLWSSCPAEDVYYQLNWENLSIFLIGSFAWHLQEHSQCLNVDITNVQ